MVSKNSGEMRSAPYELHAAWRAKYNFTRQKRWSSLREGENMNHNWLSGKEEQRENVQSQCLSIGNVSGVGTGCINAFVIWRSAWEELHRSAPL